MSGKTAWVTGGSTGIGAALAKELARTGYTVAVSARSADKLTAMAAESYGAGRIIAYPLDVTDQAAVKQTAQKIAADLGGIQLAILCAGTYIQDDATKFEVAPIEAQFKLNVMGTMYVLDALFPLMREKQDSHIAVIASVAGYRGLPRAIGYGGTKAALINMTEAMKLDCDAMGIKLQLICPGFVKTPLTDKNTFPMPFLINTDQAVKYIMDGLNSKRFEIVFPPPMAFMMKLIRFLPYALLFPLLRKGTGAGPK